MKSALLVEGRPRHTRYAYDDDLSLWVEVRVSRLPDGTTRVTVEVSDPKLITVEVSGA